MNNAEAVIDIGKGITIYLPINVDFNNFHVDEIESRLDRFSSDIGGRLIKIINYEQD